MLCTVSTVKDTLDNVRSFVVGNLRGGADHLFVFMDAPDTAVRRFLDNHPSVTCVRTNAAWWQGERPRRLNARQQINANAVRTVLSAFDEVDWLVHVDADERVNVDRGLLDELDPAVSAIRLTPLESVSVMHPVGGLAGVREFKRLLDPEDLILLTTLGVISRPKNGAYFHGHIHGKSGVRPRLDRWLTLHHAVDHTGARLPAHVDDSLRVLHYESWSGEEFLRKWTSLLAAGPQVGLRPLRAPTARAFAALAAKDLPPERARRYAERLFELTTADDVQTLHDLDLLVEVDPTAGRHRPQALPHLEEVETLLGGLARRPKGSLLPRGGIAGSTQALRQTAAELRSEPPLVARIERALDAVSR